QAQAQAQAQSPMPPADAVTPVPDKAAGTPGLAITSSPLRPSRSSAGSVPAVATGSASAAARVERPTEAHGFSFRSHEPGPHHHRGPLSSFAVTQPSLATPPRSNRKPQAQ